MPEKAISMAVLKIKGKGQAAVVKEAFHAVFLSFRLNIAIFTSQMATRGYSGHCSPFPVNCLSCPLSEIGPNAFLMYWQTAVNIVWW